ncbi:MULTISPECIES: hypothetical protein [Brevundimonas]|uniref:Uncharacterized protein n=1 Tax=Brevundimonas abyssalis TAR-001 TaxID=1391729 RepID=A0A8E0TSF3_9CAUL|nr:MULTISPECIES: hypothetical protein [Brevundimonas]MBA4001409.1 hypothetical protein [Brevundimonas sp.]MBG7616014.1 hypothetical protein [Brevundimonas sp. BAL450]GAD60427.1 hypothetical protein MBEBAB_2677 [Brevundimonas abyssalis TAR-001]
MSETITIIRRMAEAANGDLGADFRAGLSVGLAEAERQHPGFLDGLRRTEGERPLASIARRAALLRREG